MQVLFKNSGIANHATGVNLRGWKKTDLRRSRMIEGSCLIKWFIFAGI